MATEARDSRIISQNVSCKTLRNVGKIKMFSHKQKLWETLPKEYALGKTILKGRLICKKEMASK